MAEVDAGPPPVSVIIPAYGVASYLGEALASLVAQDWSDFEAIVVDDGQTVEVAQAFAPFATERRFRLLQTDNRGVATARNRGIAASRGRYVSFLDGDDRYLPSYLMAMIHRIESDSRLGFVSCDAVYFGGREPKGACYSQRYCIAGPHTLARVLARDTHVFTAVIARREALIQVGGFDDMLAAAEDLDLWIRLLAAGWSAAVLEQPLVQYRRRAGSLSSDQRRLLASSESLYRKQVAKLAGRPEQAIAKRMLRSCRRQLRRLDLEAAMRRGWVYDRLASLNKYERGFFPLVRLALARSAAGAARILLRCRGLLLQI